MGWLPDVPSSLFRPCLVSPTPTGIAAQSLRTRMCQPCRGLIPAHPKIRVRLNPTWKSPRPNTCRSGPFQGGKKTRQPTRGRNPERAVTRRMGELGGVIGGVMTWGELGGVAT
jgi:hypothetical protein